MEWLDKEVVKDRGQLSKAAIPNRIHRASWAHAYQVGLHDAVKYGSIWWFLKHKYYASRTK